MKSLVMKFGHWMPDWVLHIHRDPIGRRTWVMWFRAASIRASFGYKLGDKVDRVYIQFFGFRKYLVWH